MQDAQLKSQSRYGVTLCSARASRSIAVSLSWTLCVFLVKLRQESAPGFIEPNVFD
jgi:hypothetical protein